MDWSQFTHYIDKFTNKPLVYGIFIVLVSFACAFILFSQTSIGKKAINKAISLHKESVKKANDTLKKVEDVETLAKEKIEALTAQYEQKAQELEQAYQQKVATVVSILNYNEEYLFKILELIPNAKVQNELVTFKENYNQKKEEISGVVGLLYSDFDATIEIIKNDVRNEYEEKIGFLENQLATLQLYFNELKKEESNDGQREEETNSNPTEETL